MTDFNALPFTHAVWFMENGDDQWRICALTMDEGDAAAIVTANDPTSGAMQSLPVGQVPSGKHY
jgi:hypothetical protein